MEICISISASTPAEYQDALNALNAGIKAPAAPAKRSPAPQAAPVQAHVPTPFAKPQAPQQPAVAVQEETTAKPVTLEDLQTTGRKLALAGKQDKLGEILGKYGVRKLSDIPGEHWAEALNEMEVSINGYAGLIPGTEVHLHDSHGGLGNFQSQGYRQSRGIPLRAGPRL